MVKIRDALQISLTYISTIFILIGVATPEWSVYNTIIVLDTLESSAGLFVQCVNDECGKLTGRFGEEYTSTAFVVLGTIFLLVSAGCNTVQFVKRNETSELMDKLPHVTAATALAATVCLIIGCVVYSYELFTDYVQPGYSFYFTFIGAFVLSIGATIGRM